MIQSWFKASAARQAQLEEMKRGQQQLIDQLKQETNEQLSQLLLANHWGDLGLPSLTAGIQHSTIMNHLFH